jgi:hypothetical protein
VRNSIEWMPARMFSINQLTRKQPDEGIFLKYLNYRRPLLNEEKDNLPDGFAENHLANKGI